MSEPTGLELAALSSAARDGQLVSFRGWHARLIALGLAEKRGDGTVWITDAGRKLLDSRRTGP